MRDRLPHATALRRRAGHRRRAPRPNIACHRTPRAARARTAHPRAGRGRADSAAALRQQRDGRLRAAPRRSRAGENTCNSVGEQFAGRALDCACSGRMRPHHHRCADAAGADTVVIRKSCASKATACTSPPTSAHGANVRHAGRRRAVGDAVLAPGQVLTPARVATVASLGIDQLDRVARGPRSPCSRPATNSCTRHCRSNPARSTTATASC
jgi:hypothetical protein